MSAIPDPNATIAFIRADWALGQRVYARIGTFGPARISDILLSPDEPFALSFAGERNPQPLESFYNLEMTAKDSGKITRTK